MTTDSLVLRPLIGAHRWNVTQTRKAHTMRSFIFLFRDGEGNNAFWQVEAGSLPSAYDAFNDAFSAEPYAVVEGCNMEMREFLA